MWRPRSTTWWCAPRCVVRSTSTPRCACLRRFAASVPPDSDATLLDSVQPQQKERSMSVLDPRELQASPLADLHALAAELGLEGYRRLRKDDLIDQIVAAQGGTYEAPAAAEPEPEAEPDDPEVA